MMNKESYKQLAERLDELPNGFPPAEDGAELKLLAKLFTPEEATLGAKLRLTLETPAQIAARIDGDPKAVRDMLKGMARQGLITVRRVKGEKELSYGLMPFVVGFYETQLGRMDTELAHLFEDYYQKVFGSAITIQPQIHRVIPVNESVQMDMEVRPYESATTIVDNAQAWGVVDCICRKQKALIGDPCDHPLDVCMIMSEIPGVFDNSTSIQAQTREEAQATLQRAANAGLVHSVSNNQEGLWYICNCCTCSCGILRGMAELGMANVVARSAFVNTVDAELCIGCEDCVPFCQFDALALDGDVMTVNETRCVGCGVCVRFCLEGSLNLVRRPEAEIKPIPVTEADWRTERAAARGINLDKVL